MITSATRWFWTPNTLLDQFIKDIDVGRKPKVTDLWIKADIYDALMHEIEDRFGPYLVYDPNYPTPKVPMLFGVCLHREPK